MLRRSARRNHILRVEKANEDRRGLNKAIDLPNRIISGSGDPATGPRVQMTGEDMAAPSEAAVPLARASQVLPLLNQALSGSDLTKKENREPVIEDTRKKPNAEKDLLAESRDMRPPSPGLSGSVLAMGEKPERTIARAFQKSVLIGMSPDRSEVDDHSTSKALAGKKIRVKTSGEKNSIGEAQQIRRGVKGLSVKSVSRSLNLGLIGSENFQKRQYTRNQPHPILTD